HPVLGLLRQRKVGGGRTASPLREDPPGEVQGASSLFRRSSDKEVERGTGCRTSRGAFRTVCAGSTPALQCPSRSEPREKGRRSRPRRTHGAAPVSQGGATISTTTAKGRVGSGATPGKPLGEVDLDPARAGAHKANRLNVRRQRAR